MLSTLPGEGVPAPPMPWSAEKIFSLAAEDHVNDRKPHQGVTGQNPGLHQKLAACNSTTALGVSSSQWSGTAPGATVTYEYDAYGNHWTAEGTTPNNMLYQGEEWDPDLSLLYLRARYMNPLTGRFASRDPEDGWLTNPITLHKYLYAGGDPVNGGDPTGRASQSATWGAPGIEYVGLIAAISLGAARSAPLIAQAASCVFNEAADLLKGVTSDITQPVEEISFGECSVKVGKCKRCYPVEKGGWGFRIDWSQRRSHWFRHSKVYVPGPIPHYHLYLMSQSPYPTCKCFWDDLDDGVGGFVPPGPPDNAVPLVPAWGGGPEEF